jgi:hypothetical protein
VAALTPAKTAMIAFIRTENTDGTMDSAVAVADQKVAIAAAITIEKGQQALFYLRQARLLIHTLSS